MNLTFDELRKLVEGKRIVELKRGCSISEVPGIEAITLEDGTELDLWGAADCVMVYVLLGDSEGRGQT